MTKYDKYETVIGLETHVQLSTKSKAFCGDDARFGAAANTHISTISLGHPGTLPRLNKKQVEFAVRLGLALGSEISLENRFDRKNYFYADLPKGYQVTQDAMPICVGGSLEINVKGERKKIRIHHIHMEEDAGKSIHDVEPYFSLIDLNRAGVPLLEIVSEPDLRSAEEVDAFMSTMRQLVRYLEISDGNMQEGSMRCDVNVSVRLKGAEAYGQRTEIKNQNSMRFARRAIAFERKRQIDILEAGGAIEQETLSFDPNTGETSPLRDKENANDYRYFPEPDLTPVVLTKAYIENIQQSMPPLPWVLRAELVEQYQLSDYNANLLTEEKSIAVFFKAIAQHSKNYKAIANLLINKIKPYLSERKLEIAEFPLSAATLAAFLDLIETGKVSHSVAYQRLFPELLKQIHQSPASLAQQLNLIQSDDSDFLIQLIDEAIAKNPGQVAKYKKGKKGLLGFFVGQVMRQSRGKADPKKTNQLVREKLDSL